MSCELRMHFGSLEEVGTVRLKRVRVLLGVSGVLLGAPGKHLGVLLGSSWVFVGAPGTPGGVPIDCSSWGTPGELRGVCGCFWYSWDRILLGVPGASGFFWMVLEC